MKKIPYTTRLRITTVELLKELKEEGTKVGAFVDDAINKSYKEHNGNPGHTSRKAATKR